MPSSPHPHRPAAHQLQHPDHASYSPSPRSAPLYTSSALKSHSFRSSQTSSPEVNAYDRGIADSRPNYGSVTPLQGSPAISHEDDDAAYSPEPSSSKKVKSEDISNSDAHAEADGKDQKPVSRVAKACQPCSNKKRRCDGRQPQCSVCQVLGTPCTYNHTGLKRGPPKGFRSGPKESARAKLVRTLETTVRDLINQLGKSSASTEILRVTEERNLALSLDTSEQSSKSKGKSRTGLRVSLPAEGAEGADETAADEKALDASDEDVIGETRMGELVYRGSSSGIGILQRQHRAESPAASRPRTQSHHSSSSVPQKAKDSRSDQMTSFGPQQPSFLPISPRGSAATSNNSGHHDKSPQQSRDTPKKDAVALHSPYPVSSKAGQLSDDPIVSNAEHASLFRYYWQGFHPFYPILYKPWMISFPVEKLREHLEPSLLYAIYAIAACIEPSTTAVSADATSHPVHDHERAQCFCTAAERHVLAKGLRPDVASIQTCWLLSLYSHGVGDLSRAWNFQNLASSMAVDLGLHRWPIYRPEIVQDPVQRETRIRIIWHCYIIDKLLCAEMGRPVGLRAKEIDVPLLSETEDDEFELWSDQGARTSSAARRLHAPSCLNWGIHLFKIVEQILDEVHSLRRKALLRRQGKEKVLADLDRQLTDWKTNLPQHLHLDDSTRDGPFPSFFALNMWYYTARLLLHRPFIPQEEGVSLSVVLENDSHRKSTEAANTICDLLEASSRDFVDRLSTDLGYCLFTAAVMFVFNARLADKELSKDARRRYGLCKQWLQQLADTWPAASAHRLLLDGFATVGEDASKQTGGVGNRRTSIAAIAQASGDATGGLGDTPNISNWIAQTDAAARQLDQQGPPSRQTQPTPASTLPYGTTNTYMSQGNVQQDGSWPQGFPETGNNAPGGGVYFAPGIFDVESFFWNENAVQPTMMAAVNQAYPGTGQPEQQQNGYSSFPNVQPGNNAPVYDARQKNDAAYGMDQQTQMYGQDRRVYASYPAQQEIASAQQFNQAEGGYTGAQQSGTSGTFTTSPFAFAPTSQSMGEFWSMLELPPAFLQ